jgi:hypothetical protein
MIALLVQLAAAGFLIACGVLIFLAWALNRPDR